MKNGFTLAEVLITLGITGVIAALTIPGVITNYQKKVTVIKLKKLYLNFENAIKLTELQEGVNKDNWNFSSVNERNDFIESKIIPNLNCQTVLNKIGNSSSRYAPVCLLNDGGLIAFHNYAATTLKAIEIFFITDAKAMSKNQIIWGKNGFYYIMYFSKSDELIQTRENLVMNCKVNSNNDYSSRSCFKLIIYDGWEIKDDYPW